MLYPTHVYLGPTLDLVSARNLLPHAHYHPPIQCGELLRLLRLDPKRIIIIDGYYEFTPAVWHKEILHVMDQGIEVWGAASMGALRAAELHTLGMKGFGRIYTDFASGKLNDDDEVAVLHTNSEDAFEPINDAMVNIRETLRIAYQQGIIRKQLHDALLDFCKLKFYPHRSLMRAIDEYKPLYAHECNSLTQWIMHHGMVDLKKQDAITVLQQANQTSCITLTNASAVTPMTGYLKTLLNYATATPFKHQADWLPILEQQFQVIAQKEPIKHQVLAELSVFLRQLAAYIPENVKCISSTLILDYIKLHNLYSPAEDFSFLQQDPSLAEIYVLILQLICETKLTASLIESYLPAITHYYDVSEAQLDVPMRNLLKRLLVVIMLMKIRYVDVDAIVDNQYVSNHLSRIATKRGYNTEQAERWIDATHLDNYYFMSFLMMYLMSAGCVQSFNSIEHVRKIEYSKWVYSVLNSL